MSEAGEERTPLHSHIHAAVHSGRLQECSLLGLQDLQALAREEKGVCPDPARQATAPQTTCVSTASTCTTGARVFPPCISSLLPRSLQDPR